MKRCAPLLSVLATRLESDVDEHAEHAAAWEEAWQTALSSDVRRDLVRERMRSAIARRDTTTRRVLDGVRAQLVRHRSAVQSAVVRLVRDAFDQAAIAPYIGRAPTDVMAARDAAIQGVVGQWTGLIERDVSRANAELARLASRIPWADEDAVRAYVHERLGAVPWALGPIAKVQPVRVSAEQVLCEVGTIDLHAGPAAPSQRALASLTARAEDIARRMPQETPAIGWDPIRDTWGRM